MKGANVLSMDVGGCVSPRTVPREDEYDICTDGEKSSSDEEFSQSVTQSAGSSCSMMQVTQESGVQDTTDQGASSAKTTSKMAKLKKFFHKTEKPGKASRKEDEDEELVGSGRIFGVCMFPEEEPRGAIVVDESRQNHEDRTSPSEIENETTSIPAAGIKTQPQLNGPQKENTNILSNEGVSGQRPKKVTQNVLKNITNEQILTTGNASLPQNNYFNDTVEVSGFSKETTFPGSGSIFPNYTRDISPSNIPLNATKRKQSEETTFSTLSEKQKSADDNLSTQEIGTPSFLDELKKAVDPENIPDCDALNFLMEGICDKLSSITDTPMPKMHLRGIGEFLVKIDDKLNNKVNNTQSLTQHAKQLERCNDVLTAEITALNISAKETKEAEMHCIRTREMIVKKYIVTIARLQKRQDSVREIVKKMTVHDRNTDVFKRDMIALRKVLKIRLKKGKPRNEEKLLNTHSSHVRGSNALSRSDNLELSTDTYVEDDSDQYYQNRQNTNRNSKGKGNQECGYPLSRTTDNSSKNYLTREMAELHLLRYFKNEACHFFTRFINFSRSYQGDIWGNDCRVRFTNLFSVIDLPYNDIETSLENIQDIQNETHVLITKVARNSLLSRLEQVILENVKDASLANLRKRKASKSVLDSSPRFEVCDYEDN
ncbi:hypothetical protein DAKH74_019230 [Maudiozyma humilis]|uniref:Uncharacterized protein n=1 Tax=Maudiozyma humilis TaxID=51915 RepID=A0AAV5RVE4_MAUHU|nr:hypothetical protein DAKH74_019230 [Kazachstania humilis]